MAQAVGARPGGRGALILPTVGLRRDAHHENDRTNVRLETMITPYLHARDDADEGSRRRALLALSALIDDLCDPLESTPGPRFSRDDLFVQWQRFGRSAANDPCFDA